MSSNRCHLVPCIYKGHKLVTIRNCEMCKKCNTCDIYAMMLDDEDDEES